jgi:hypothetical protein
MRILVLILMLLSQGVFGAEGAGAGEIPSLAGLSIRSLLLQAADDLEVNYLDKEADVNHEDHTAVSPDARGTRR